MRITKYRYIGTSSVPGYGCIGEAGPASGCDDRESIEFGAWVLTPDVDPADPEGEPGAYYVDPQRDLEVDHYDVSGCTYTERLAMDLQSDPHALGFYGDCE